MQKECIALIQFLQKRNYTILLETNGTMPIKNLPEITIIMDIKCPSSKEHKKVLKELKSTNKDLEIKTKDLLIAVSDLEKLKIENSSMSNEVKTLKEVMKYPNKAINTDEGKKLIDY